MSIVVKGRRLTGVSCVIIRAQYQFWSQCAHDDGDDVEHIFKQRVGTNQGNHLEHSPRSQSQITYSMHYLYIMYCFFSRYKKSKYFFRFVLRGDTRLELTDINHKLLIQLPEKANSFPSFLLVCFVRFLRNFFFISIHNLCVLGQLNPKQRSYK